MTEKPCDVRTYSCDECGRDYPWPWGPAVQAIALPLKVTMRCDNCDAPVELVITKDEAVKP